MGICSIRGCRESDFFGLMEPISARRWLVDSKCGQMTSFCPDGSKVRFAVGYLRD